MKKRPWLKWIGIVLCAVITVLIAIAFYHVKEANEAERAELREVAKHYEEAIRPLWNEKAQLEREIAEQEKVVEAEAPPSPVILLCTEPSEKLLSDVYPIASQYGYPAAIVISEDALPGDADCLTESDVVYLLDQGWELCLGADAETDLAALYQRVTDAGLPSPVTVYYPAGGATKVQEEQMPALGIQTVIRYGKKTAAGGMEGLWYLSAYGSNEEDSKTVFQAGVRNAMPQVLTVGYSKSREQFSATNYSNMLKTVNSYELAGDIQVLSIQNASAAYLRSLNGAFSETETEAQRHLRELKEELAAVNEKIWEFEREKG